MALWPHRQKGDWLIEPRFKCLDAYFDSKQTQVGLAVAKRKTAMATNLYMALSTTRELGDPPHL